MVRVSSPLETLGSSLSILSLRFVVPTTVVEFGRLVLSILSLRFCVLGSPSLSFRFRLRIGLTLGFISFYLRS